ncbi:hypothetical protein [Escherichia coli]|uniref:hypothetical protein n=1 Tax=Escherichia coli TaxID=562 RepID=UPI003FA088ED
MSYSDVVATIALLVSVLGTFASGYISYHYAIKGEKRKEFNAIADAISISLSEQLSFAYNGKFPQETLSSSEIYALENVCPIKQKKALKVAIDRYVGALSSCGDYDRGVFKFHSPMKLINAINALLLHCAHK